MTNSRKEKTHINRLDENGIPIDFDSGESSFSVVIFPIVSIDVDAEILTQFAVRMSEEVRESGLKCELTAIVIIVMILNPRVTNVAKDLTSWRRVSREYRIRRRIDFFDWQIAKPKEKKALLKKCVIDCIADIPMKHLAEESKQALAVLVNQAIGPKKKAVRIAQPDVE